MAVTILVFANWTRWVEVDLTEKLRDAAVVNHKGGLPKTCPALSSCVTIMETRIYKVKLMLIRENSRNITSAKMVTEAEKANQALCEHV